MKTIAIFSGYALPHLGGIERYIKNLTDQFISKGFRVIIVSSNYDNFSTIEKNGNIINLRVPIYNTFSSRYPIIKHHNKEYKKVIHELKNYKIDRIIVNTRFHLTTLMGARFGNKYHIPVYLIEHGSAHLSINNKLLDFMGSIYEHLLTKKVEKYVDYNYGVSKAACDWQKHFNIESDGIWYNSINVFDQNKITKSKNKVVILYAGRILKQKGLEDLVKAFINLNKKHKNIELIIAGDGDYLSYLVNNYKNKNISYLGIVKFEDLVKLYAKANIFVHPSKYPEGLPTCILEAGLMECAVVCSPNGGTKYFIDGNNGVVIDSNDELEQALEKYITNKKLCESSGKNLKKTVLKEFTWEKTAKKILKDMNI